MPRGEETLVVRGLEPLVKGLSRLERETGNELKHELKRIAKPVAEVAKSIAREKGLVDTGRLVSGVRVFATNKGAGIRETTVRKGFPYPSVYEYGNRKGTGDGVGPRAFMFPAAERSAPEVKLAVEEWLEHLLEKA